MKTEIEELIEQLPDGDYESGWAQCMIYPIAKQSMSYINGERFAIQQKNWRSKDERYATGSSLFDVLNKFLALPELVIFQTNRSSSLDFSE